MKLNRGVSFLLILLLIFSCVGCGDNSPDTESAQGKEVYTLRIKINPEFTIGYDENHMVTSLKAENQDAQDVLDKYFQGDPVGDNLDTLAQQLIIKSYTEGYAADDFKVTLSFDGDEDSSDYLQVLESMIDDFVENPYLDSSPYIAGSEAAHTDPVVVETHGQKERVCPGCSGTGEQVCPECEGTHQIPCENCSGTGVVIAHGEDEEYADVTCDMCHGSGQREKIVNGSVAGIETCPNCGGKGTRYMSTGNTIVHDDEVSCPQCEGRGWNPCQCCEDGYIQCETCHGDKFILD